MTDQLTLATALSLAALLLPRLGSRWPAWAHILLRLAAFVGLTVLVWRLLGSPLDPHFDEAQMSLAFWQRGVEVAWWLLAGRVAVGLARLFVVLKNRPRETRIVSDLVSGVVYVGTVLAIVAIGFSLPVRGLLATSGVIAIVLGLALQSTLSDVFSGIAVGLERPYRAGDIIWVEGGIEGRVVQVNWRSTEIGTVQNTIATVPNSVIAKARLINYSAPTVSRGVSVKIRLDARADPERCLQVLSAAVQACNLPLPEPAPGVACIGLEGDGVQYEISFSIAKSELLVAARTEIYRRVHRHLRYAGIALAVPGRQRLSSDQPTLATILAESDLFGAVEAGQRHRLAQHFTAVHLQSGEILMHRDEVPEALFVIASGTVEISRTEAEGEHVFHRLGPGETLGATGLITNSPSQAMAAAATPVRAYRLGHEDIASAIEAEPGLTAGLEALVSRGLDAMRRDVTARDDVQSAQPELFLAKLRQFLHLLRTEAV